MHACLWCMHVSNNIVIHSAMCNIQLATSTFIDITLQLKYMQSHYSVASPK